MSAATILLYGVAGVPMALALLALWPSARERLIHALPFAALPALAASLVVEAGSATPLPRMLLGAPLMLDAPGRLFLGIGALLWTLAGIYAHTAIRGKTCSRFAGFWLATLSGNMLLYIAADLISFYLAFAALSLAAFGLVAHEGSAEARRAARIYLVLAIFGEILLLLALMLGASAAGSILIADVRAALPAAQHRDLTLALLIGGFGVKAGLVPLHVWLPLAHPAAPVPASSVLSGAIVKAGIFGLIQFLPLEAELPRWSATLVVMGLVTAYYGAVVGVFQQRPKTVLAYSTLSQMGLVIVVIGSAFGSPAVGIAVAAAALYAAHHGLAKGALFLAVGVLHSSGGPVRLVMLAVAALLALAIAGLPFSGGALAKLAVKGPLGSGVAASLVTLSAVGTTLLMLRFLQLIRRDRPAEHWRPPPWHAAAFLLCAVFALIVPWVLFPRTSELTLGYALDLSNLWAAAWPILIGASVTAAARWRLRRSPALPEGDLIVVAERALARLQSVAGRRHFPSSYPGLGKVQAWSPPVAGWLAAAERSLARWETTGLILLVTGLLISALVFTEL